MRNAPNGIRDGSPAASEARRRPVRVPFGAKLLFGAVIALIFTLVPMSIDVNNPASVNVHRNEAEAAQANTLATGFLEKLALEAGLTAGDFVAVVAGGIASSSGMIIANDSGIKLGNSLQDNLEAVVETVDYPDWKYLTPSEQQLWKSKTNYDASKFASLLNAVGLDTAYNRYKGSGGGNLDLEDGELSIVKHIGAIGQTWIDRGGVAFSDLSNTFSKSGAQSSIGVQFKNVDMSTEVLWPSTWPTNLKMVYTDWSWYKYVTGNRTYYRRTNIPAYTFFISNGTDYIERDIFINETFTYGGSNKANLNTPDYYSTPVTGGITPTALKVGNEVVGYKSVSTYTYDNDSITNLPVNICPGCNFADRDTAMICLLNKGYNGNTNYENVAQYPNTPINGDTPIYYPSPNSYTTEQPELQPGNNWDQFITRPTNPSGGGGEGGDNPGGDTPGERPENPYNPSNPENPGYQSGTPEWNQQTEENMMPLMNIRFDSLFPFCLVFDIQKLFNKVQSVTGNDSQSGIYNIVELPFWLPGSNANVVLDLTMIRTLLLAVRPFVQILLGALLLFTVIEFWRGILTGD